VKEENFFKVKREAGTAHIEHTDDEDPRAIAVGDLDPY
jgi:hypothetical protein